MNIQEQNNLSEEEIVQKVEQEKQTGIESTQKELVLCKQSVAEWQERCARLSADFENYKKRMVKEQAQWMQSARITLLSNLLTIIDNFNRAMEHKQKAESTDAKNWIDGIAMIYTSFGEFLKKAGVVEVTYGLFDPMYHEALMHVSSDMHKPGEIVEVFEKGYMIDDHVLRPAKVSVAK